MRKATILDKLLCYSLIAAQPFAEASVESSLLGPVNTIWISVAGGHFFDQRGGGREI